MPIFTFILVFSGPWDKVVIRKNNNVLKQNNANRTSLILKSIYINKKAGGAAMKQRFPGARLQGLTDPWFPVCQQDDCGCVIVSAKVLGSPVCKMGIIILISPSECCR